MDGRKSSESSDAPDDPLEQLIQRIGAEAAYADNSPRRQASLKMLLDKLDLIALADGTEPVLDPEHSELDATIAELRSLPDTGNSDRKAELIAKLQRLVVGIIQTSPEI